MNTVGMRGTWRWQNAGKSPPCGKIKPWNLQNGERDLRSAIRDPRDSHVPDGGLRLITFVDYQVWLVGGAAAWAEGSVARPVQGGSFEPISSALLAGPAILPGRPFTTWRSRSLVVTLLWMSRLSAGSHRRLRWISRIGRSPSVSAAVASAGVGRPSSPSTAPVKRAAHRPSGRARS